MSWIGVAVLLMFGPVSAQMPEIVVHKVDMDLEKREKISDDLFKDASEAVLALSAQPMVTPRPAKTETSELKVRAVQNGRWLALRFQWKDDGKSDSGKTGESSDAVAVQFPVRKNDNPPPFFMGAKGDPVHILHWRAHYQAEEKLGRREMKDLYPNQNPDMYPMEFKDPGNLKGLTEEKRVVYSPAKAVGNPQAFLKTAVDEILAEGFGTSSVMTERESFGFGEWKDGVWVVYIARALKREKVSSLKPPEKNFAAFAVWQGGLGEVGSRKSVTMGWIPITWKVGK